MISIIVKSKLTSENSELARQLEDLEHQVGALQKAKISITTTS